ncbi:MAG: SDR family NAD(P)-dependent oxidoreductase [Pseudobdellovibrionaceae bacterium]
MKLAIVTGASSGIGAEASRHLARSGFKVLLVARRQTELEQVTRSIGSNAVSIVCDSSSGNEVLSLAEKIKNQHGVPDLIVNCAGTGEWKFIEDTTPAEAHRMMEAPYFAAFHMSHAFMREMLKRGSGILIHVNSPAAFLPWPCATGYTAARWALRGLHEALCQDLRGTGVKSCHLVLSRVDSPYFEQNKDLHRKIPGVSKLIRTLTPEECGEIIAKLARSPRRQVFYPWMFRLFIWIDRIFPFLTLGLLRMTGFRKHQLSADALPKT